MKRIAAIAIVALASQTLMAQSTLREAYEGKFLIGTAVNIRQPRSDNKKIKDVIKNQFSAVVPENCMKPEEIHPKKDLYDFSEADELMKFAKKNKQVVTGHCLVWHSQVPYWFFKDDMSNQVTKEELLDRMKNHIYTVVRHFKGKIKGWDVVNEAINDDGSMRQSQFYRIIGPDFIKYAFQFAHEADPNVELYYNDYSMDNPKKRDAVVKLIRELKAAGLRIDGVGMQSHVAYDTPLDEYEKSIEAFAAEGVKVMVTELDLSVLPSHAAFRGGAEVSTQLDYQNSLNPYTDGLPYDAAKKQSDFMCKLFDIYLRHQKVIDRVTFWGVSDGDSWKNGWPIPFRTDYPLAIDRNYEPKMFVPELIKMANDPKYDQYK